MRKIRRKCKSRVLALCLSRDWQLYVLSVSVRDSEARLNQLLIFLLNTHGSAKSSLFASFHSSHKLLENQNGKSDSSYRLLKQIPLSACGVTPAPKARLLGPSACSISQNKLFLIVVVQEEPFEKALQALTLFLAF